MATGRRLREACLGVCVAWCELGKEALTRAAGVLLLDCGAL